MYLLKFNFGDDSTSIERSELNSFKSQEELWSIPILNKIQKEWDLKYFFSLNQIHSDIGHIIKLDNLNNYLTNLSDGDYLVTNMGQTALGIYSADCLPIIFHDELNNAIGICHAGWIGSLKKIAIKTLVAMQKNFGTKPENCIIIFGPSAKKCCYKVSSDFKSHLENFENINQVLIELNNQNYFDVPLFNYLELICAGINTKSINLENNICTMCNLNFCSYRREGDKARRQLSIVSL